MSILTLFGLGILRVAGLLGGGGGEWPRPITLKSLVVMKRNLVEW